MSNDGTGLRERDSTKADTEQGLFRKYDVRRMDFTDQPGGKHDGCEYFVLDVTHDPHAAAALAAYAASVEVTHPHLAADMRERYALSAVAPPPVLAPRAKQYPKPDENGNDTGPCCAHAYADGWNECRAAMLAASPAAPAQPEGGEAVLRALAHDFGMFLNTYRATLPSNAMADSYALHNRLNALAWDARPAPAQQAVTEWQPIETAPKDGAPILVWFDVPGLGVMRVTWEDPYGNDGESAIWCVDDNKHGPYPLRGYRDGDEKGWMPLPASNAAASAADAQEGA